MEPRKTRFAGADVVDYTEGERSQVAAHRGRVRPDADALPGSESGACEQGLPGNLGGLVVSVRDEEPVRGEPVDQNPGTSGGVRSAAGGEDRALWMVSGGEGRPEPTETDGEASERLQSTDEAGELTREDPVEGRRASDHGAVGGKDQWRRGTPVRSQRDCNG